MSLAAAAHHLASKGRHGDSMLVHMTPREVAGLHALALAHGKKITTNPDTGLPEAFSLKSLLPMLAGAFLGPAGMGLFSSSLTAGLGVGALTGLATGSLRQGLMAGLGAYGGSGLLGSVTGAGAGAIGNAAEAANAANVGSVTGGGMAAVPSAVPNIPMEGIAGTPPIQNIPAMATPDAAFLQSQAGMPVDPATQSVVARATPMAPPMEMQPVQQVAPSAAQSPSAAVPDTYRNQMDIASDKAAAAREAGKWNQFKAGLGAIADKPSLLFNKDNMKYGLAAAAPMMFEEPKSAKYEGGGPNPYQYSYSANPTGKKPDPFGRYEQTYFRPAYTRLAEGGDTSEADKYRYEYDPTTQTYKPVVSETKATQPEKTTSTGAGNEGSSPAEPNIPGDPSHPLAGLLAPIGTQIGNAINSIAGFFGSSPVISTGDNTVVGYDPGAFGLPSPGESTPGESTPGESTPGEGGGMSNSGEGGPGSPGGWAYGGLTALARGGYSHLGDYSDGGRLLRGPGDGVSDSIPATIADKRPARLADGEFVIPARIVSELGNGSTDAGARKLYAMMDRIQKARTKTVGKGKVAVNSRAEKLLPA